MSKQAKNQINNSRKPDCVIIDTNIWRSGLLLKTPIGVSLVYTLNRQAGFIGLPEVVEREMKKQVVEAGLEATRNLTKYASMVNTLTDCPFPPHSLPTSSELEEKVERRLTELAPILIRIPFTLEHAKVALDMVNKELPPNGPKNQQFKDSAIWLAALSVAKQYKTHLVTNDLGFFRDRNDPSKGLASNLLDDCRTAGAVVHPHCDVPSCLDAVTSDVPAFDRERLRDLIMQRTDATIEANASRHKFKVGPLAKLEMKAFRAGQTEILAVDYVVIKQFTPPSADMTYGGSEFRAILHGNCYYDPTSDSITSNFISSISFKWRNQIGTDSVLARSFEEEDPSIIVPRAWINV